MRKLSLWSLLLVAALTVIVRLCYFENNSKNGNNATTYDALGYYMYTPAILIHKDVKQYSWFPKIDSTYHVSGGLFYQVTPAKNGNFAGKYFGGVSIMQLPFFTIGHLIAKTTDAPEDGFSWPYQYSIIWGAIFWYLLGLFVLRKVLIRYYSETVTALTLIGIGFASNVIQYAGIDGAQSHIHIFPLYCLVLWWTIRWHENPKLKFAFFIGFTIGLATICRPTELIMFFIPLLWGLDGSENLKSKWALVKVNMKSVYIAVLGAFIGILPQLIYWKYVTGSWVFDVGSKWTFLNPWWRVLIGFEKGWFIYTPITILFVIGLFLMKGKPFRKAVLTFGLLNIWIVISWFDWRYGGTYSTRALVQGTPVLALAFAAFIERIYVGWRRYLFLSVLGFLSFVNLFQIWQYNETILHYDHMNAKYYNAIYLDANPSPLDYSLLDTEEQLEAGIPLLKQIVLPEMDTILSPGTYPIYQTNTIPANWLSTELSFVADYGVKQGTIHVACYKEGKVQKERFFRLAVPQAKNKVKMTYQNQFRLNDDCDSCAISLDVWKPMKLSKLKTRISCY